MLYVSIKHNEALINSKVDSMEIAQESFVDFWIWSGVFFMNILVYHVFHAYGMGVSWNTLLRVIVTMALSGIGYLVVASMVARWKNSDEDEANPNVDDEIRAVSLMSISRTQGSE